MNALAIDTTGEALGLALSAGDGQLHGAIRRVGLRHAELLAPAVSALLAQAGLEPARLELVVCATGPGSFTGVRIALATAKGLALGAGCPIVGVPTLDALAYRFAFFPGTVVPVIDARKGRVYAARYALGERASAFLDLGPDALARLLLAETGPSGLLLTGPFAAGMREPLERARQALPEQPALYVDTCFADTDPLSLLQMGLRKFERAGGDGDDLAPLYLRPSEAELKAGG